MIQSKTKWVLQALSVELFVVKNPGEATSPLWGPGETSQGGVS